MRNARESMFNIITRPDPCKRRIEPPAPTFEGMNWKTGVPREEKKIISRMQLLINSSWSSPKNEDCTGSRLAQRLGRRVGAWETVGVGVVEGEREREVWEAHSEHRFPAPSSKFTLRASLSGTFLQTHTPSIAFRHLAPNSHSEHRFPAPSSRLCQIWLRL